MPGIKARASDNHRCGTLQWSYIHRPGMHISFYLLIRINYESISLWGCPHLAVFRGSVLRSCSWHSSPLNFLSCPRLSPGLPSLPCHCLQGFRLHMLETFGAPRDLIYSISPALCRQLPLTGDLEARYLFNNTPATCIS